MDIMFKLLQLKQSNRYNVIKRITNKVHVWQIKKSIKNNISNNDKLFEVYTDFCHLVESVESLDLQIELPWCKTIPYDNGVFISIFRFEIKTGDLQGYILCTEYKTNELFQMHIKLEHNYGSINRYGYDIYLEKEQLVNYNTNDSQSSKMKSEVISVMKRQMLETLTAIIDTYYNKYLISRKEGITYENATETIRQD